MSTSTSTVHAPPRRSRFGSLIRELWFQVSSAPSSASPSASCYPTSVRR